MRKSGAIFLSLAIVLQLAAIATLLAVGGFQGKKGEVARNYMLLLDVSSIKNTHNSTGLPDERDHNNLKDFFAIYMRNYCSGKLVQGRYDIDYCSKADGKELFDYTDHDWEDYGVDFLNITGITPRSLTKRKGGGGGGSRSGGSSSSSRSPGSSSSKGSSSKSQSKNLSSKTAKAKARAKTRAATPVYAVSFGSTFLFRIWMLVLFETGFSILFGLLSIWFYWSSFVAAFLCWMAMLSSIALAADPKDYYKKFGKFLKTYKGPNGTTASYKVGTLPFSILWVTMAALVLSSIVWVVCFFLLLPKKPKCSNVDATADVEASNTAPEDRDFDIKQDVKEKIAPIAPAPKESMIARFKNLPVKFWGLNRKPENPLDYEPVQGGGHVGMQQDTSYASPSMSSYGNASSPAYMQQPHTDPVYEPMRAQ